MFPHFRAVEQQIAALGVHGAYAAHEARLPTYYMPQ